MTFTSEVPEVPGRYYARWPELNGVPASTAMDDVSYLGDGLAALSGEYVLEASALEWGDLIDAFPEELVKP